MKAWMAERDLVRGAPVRLICLPHAGSGAAGFYRWKRLLAGRVDVCPVLLPGREGRLGEACAASVEEVAAALVRERELFAGPYAIFGHSMGALLAFGLARAIAEAGLRAPEYLFVSGRDAPQTTVGGAVLHRLGDEEFLAALDERYGVAAAGLMEDAELRALFLPILRGDLRLVESFRYAAGERLRCPMFALAGVEDRSVSAQGLEAWGELTDAGFEVRRLPGDHFYHFAAGQRELLDFICGKLRGAADADCLRK